MISIDLSQRVAIITGGIQGLGLATAQTFRQAGARVAINYFDDPAGISRARAEQLRETWRDDDVFIAAADVRDRDQMLGFYQEVKARYQRLDFLVNNAAILRDRTLKKLTDDEWSAVLDTNLTAVFRATQVALPLMEDGGRIVNMASISGVMGFFGQANYASAKAGIIAFTKVLSRELASRRINVNAVAPGVILTEMGQSIPEAAREQMLTQIPLNRFGEPGEIASVILFLCSELASYMTGQTLHVNGGWWSA